MKSYRPGAIRKPEKECKRDEILRSGRQSLRVQYEMNVGEGRKEWRLFAEVDKRKRRLTEIAPAAR